MRSCVTEFGECIQIVTESAGKLNMTDGQNPRRLIDGGDQVIDLRSVRPGSGTESKRDSPARQVHPGIEIDGYSSVAETTLSPSRQGNPSAIRPMPWVVLWIKAISSRSSVD